MRDIVDLLSLRNRGVLMKEIDQSAKVNQLDLSVILPIFEEEESVPHLIDEITQVLRPSGLTFEILCVDDGSKDQSFRVLQDLMEEHPEVVAVRFRRNFGQSAAMQAGLDLSAGRAVAFMDADLQNDPHDIPKMWQLLWTGQEINDTGEENEQENISLNDLGLDPLSTEGYDMVVGWRADRKDRFINRRLPSLIANRLIAKVTGVSLHDYGCSLKLIRGDLAKHLKIYGEMHRFIPAIASWTGATIHEVKVNHRARQFGESKYGIGRTIRVLLDLIVVRFMQGFLVKPMQVFGLAGLVSFMIGLMICTYLSIQKLFLGTELAERPLLLLGILLLVVGVQLLSLGLVADLLARTYHESQNKPPYAIRHCIRSGKLPKND